MVEASYGCPVEVTVEAIGGKWKCVIFMVAAAKCQEFWRVATVDT